MYILVETYLNTSPTWEILKGDGWVTSTVTCWSLISYAQWVLLKHSNTRRPAESADYLPRCTIVPVTLLGLGSIHNVQVREASTYPHQRLLRSIHHAANIVNVNHPQRGILNPSMEWGCPPHVHTWILVFGSPDFIKVHMMLHEIIILQREYDDIFDVTENPPALRLPKSVKTWEAAHEGRRAKSGFCTPQRRVPQLPFVGEFMWRDVVIIGPMYGCTAHGKVAGGELHTHWKGLGL